VLLGFRYWTDVAVIESGLMVDDIMISRYPLDDAEGDSPWTFDGFRRTDGFESKHHSNYYLAEFRQYHGYDRGLGNAYNFGWGGVPDLSSIVEHCPHQDGLLVSDWDTPFTTNNVGANCSAGQRLTDEAPGTLEPPFSSTLDSCGIVRPVARRSAPDSGLDALELEAPARG
jgi:immune inhibitor A